jgi:hypothetical protein
MVERYDGTDNAQTCVDISKKVVAELGIEDKVNAFFMMRCSLINVIKNMTW